MAIQKQIDTNFGPNIKAGYWRVGVVREDYMEQRADVVMYGYASAADRNAGGLPIMQRPWQIAGADYTEDMSRAKVYAFVKKDGFFAGGADV